jgi:hypothetical protein
MSFMSLMSLVSLVSLVSLFAYSFFMSAVVFFENWVKMYVTLCDSASVKIFRGFEFDFN